MPEQTEREKLLAEIFDISRAQREALAGDAPGEGLDTLLERRQALTDRLAGLGKVPSGREERARELYREISLQDEENENLALLAMADLRDKLRKGREGLTAARGYDASGSVDAVYFDKQK